MLKPILLVEDNPKDVELSLAALGKTQLANEVVVVRDGAEALDYLRCAGEFAARAQGNPAVVLLDLKLPKIDGLQVLEQIKSDPDLQAIPGRDADCLPRGEGPAPELQDRCQCLCG